MRTAPTAPVQTGRMQQQAATRRAAANPQKEPAKEESGKDPRTTARDPQQVQQRGGGADHTQQDRGQQGHVRVSVSRRKRFLQNDSLQGFEKAVKWEFLRF
uniref:Uncharacterized protein n=1 Tax=Knipowitschia caucasica TaxID=637954 RepID=A0AAV2JV17_KNICA